MTSFRSSTSFRVVIIALTLVCLSSWATFRAGSQSKSAAHSPDKEISKSGAASVKKTAKGSGTVTTSSVATTSTLFLAGVEQFSLGSGQVDLFTVTLGGNTAGSDTFAVGSPATLATTLSTNENKPDINNPVDIRFDKSGDLLIANGGTSNADPGSFACVPAGAVTTGANSSTTITQAGTNPTAFGYLAYDARDGSAAIANNPVSSSTQLFEYLLNGSYSAAGAPRNLIAPGFGATAVTEVPALAAGTYAVALQTGAEEDTAHGGTTGTNKVALFSPTGTRTDIADDTTFAIDQPYGLAFDSQNNQLVVANFSTWHRLLSFYNVSPVSLAKTINTTFRNTYTATSPDGHVAVAWVKQFGYMQVQVYDNTAARNPVFGPIPYNGTTTSCPSTPAVYIYGNGTAIVNGLKWLSNTKLLVAVESNNSGTPTAKNGFYIYDITNSEVPAGFDDISCSTFAAAPINTGFVHVNTHPFGVAIRGGTFVFADPSANTTTHVCNGNSPCYPTITEAIAALPSGGVVNVFGGTYNESVNLNNANVTVNIDGNTTVHAFTLTSGILNAGAGNCGQAGSFTLTLDTGNWTNNGGTFNPGTGTVAFTGTGAQSITGSNVTTFNNLTINSTSTVTPTLNTNVAGNLSVTSGTFDLLGFTANRTASGGTLSVSNGATLKIGGGNSLPTNYTTYTLGASSTVEYEGSLAQTINAVNYGHLTSSSTGARTLPNGSTVGIAGTFTPGTNAYTITGSIVNFNGTSAQTLPSGFTTYNNLTLNNSSVAGVTGFAGLTVNGLIHVQTGTFTSSSTYNNVQIDASATLSGTNATTINVSGNWTNNGTFTANGNTVNFDGSSAQSIGGASNNNFNNLTINNTSGVTASSNQTVNGALTLTNGALAIGSTTLTLNSAVNFTSGTFSSATGGTVNYNQGSNGQAVAPGGYGNLTFSNFNKTLPGSTIGIAGTFTPGNATGHTITGNTIDFNGGLSQTIPAFTYNSLTSSSTGARTLASSGNIKIAATFTPGTNAYTINGSTIEFNGGGSQTISAFTYFNLMSSSTGARTLSGNIKIAGAFAPGTNAYTITGSTVEYNGTLAQTLPSGFTTYNNLTLSNAAGVNGFSGTLNLSGNWTNNGSTFNANSGTVNFDGTATQTIGGTSATTFNNLTNSNTAGITLARDETVNGILALTSSDITVNNTFTLTQPASGTSSGTFDVVGNVKRAGFVSGGGALSFGNPDNQITINSGTVPSDITVNLVKSVPSSPAFLTAVQRTYTITPNGGSGYSATLRLHYTDAELNSNTKAGLGLFRSNGTAWVRLGETNADTANNWVELSGVTSFSASSPWTLSSAKNNSTTTINTVTPEPSEVGQSVTINYTVVGNPTGGPAPTADGTTNFVTVTDGTNSCQGSLTSGTGSCQITFNSSGVKNLTATYSGDANYNASLASSPATPHTVSPPPTISVHDAKAAEPATGTASMPFTVALSRASSQTVTVNYATADGTATGGTCGTSGIDYTTTSNTLTFLAGEVIKVVNVPVCADSGDNTEADETFTLNLSTPSANSTLGTATGTGTITTSSTAGTLIISEFRESGPGGGTDSANDDFVELYNNTDSLLTITASDTSSGYGLYKAGATCGDAPVLVAVIPNNTKIPARGHYLLTGSSYSLSNYGGTGNAAKDQQLTADIENDRNLALFSTANVSNISSVNRLDAAGFASNANPLDSCDLMREGTTLTATSGAGSNSEYSFVRKLNSGTSQDTNDNASDFMLVSTTPTTAVGSNAAPTLGAPGPENKTSPINRNATIKASLVDPCASSSVSPNRDRSITPYTDPATNAATPGSNTGTYTLGYLDIRRRFTNNTGAGITRIRFRVVDITTAPQALGNGTADLRLITSPTVTVVKSGACGGGSVPVKALTLEQPPTQTGSGGGFNATVTDGTITLGTPIGAGNVVDVTFRLGVKQSGSFRFFINVEALP